MSYSNNDLEEIKSRLDIVDVISDYVSLKKAGQNWRGLCPFHSEKTPSFMVSPSKQIFHCFGCGVGGDMFAFLIKYENFSFPEALDILAKKSGVLIKKFQRKPESAGEKENLLSLYREASIFYRENRMKNSEAARYLQKRGITDEARELFSIGYAPNKWDDLFSYIKKKGYRVEMIKKSGLIIQGAKGYYNTFRNRIIFPIFNQRGEVIAFGGRVMDDSLPKYLNSPESPIFNKSKILYGLNIAKEPIKKAGFGIFVEGYLDVITMHMNGFSNTAAPLGTALTKEHGKLMKRFTDDVVLVFDGDVSGINAAKSAVGTLLQCDLNVKVLPLPEGEDPDSLLKKKGKEAFSDFLNRTVSVVDFFAMQKGDKHVIASEALEAISKIPNSVKRGDNVKQLSEVMRFNESDLREQLKKIMKMPYMKRLSVKEHARALESHAVSRPVEEIYILQLLIQFPERAEKFIDTISVDDFYDTTVKAILTKMKNGFIDYNVLISECAEDERNLLSELLFKTEFDDPEKIFMDCRKRLETKRHQALLYELQEKIKKAESDNNNSLLKTLLQEKQELLRLKG
ncbi:MAG: DNA primase [Thermodesulfovibrionia bacterium]|nr:DNA primase [Thermodesulfovibrionia bacterium]